MTDPTTPLHQVAYGNFVESDKVTAEKRERIERAAI